MIAQTTQVRSFSIPLCSLCCCGLRIAVVSEAFRNWRSDGRGDATANSFRLSFSGSSQLAPAMTLPMRLTLRESFPDDDLCKVFPLSSGSAEC